MPTKPKSLPNDDQLMEPYEREREGGRERDIKKTQQLNKSNFLWRGTVTLLETVQKFLLETFRQLLWFIKSAYWREGEGEKRLSFQQQRFSQTMCKNKSLETGLYPGKPGSWAGACGVAPWDREPVSPSPSHFSRGPGAQKTPPGPHWAPLPPSPAPLPGMQMWSILLPLTWEGLFLTRASAHPWAEGRFLT